MKRVSGWAVGLWAVATLAGCATLHRPPQLADLQVVPAELKPGDSAMVTVRVSDRHEIIDRVEGVVKEDPRMKFKLRDDGKQPHDAGAGDGVWSLKISVPFQAPPGRFTLEFTAYNSKGEPVLVRSREGGVVPLTASTTVEIRYPQQ
ncbi:MAG: hypothetical protein HY706_15355 [Candidatus Hydrogenedentes bacterium]|nr:hypothetical protein [Candidatus Hydrogenedentota bacterium]